jgi:thiol-disulfide isomerase/thioredoxin
MVTVTLRRTSAILALALAVGACTGGEAEHVPRAEPTPAINAIEADLLPTDVAELPDFDLARFESLLGELRGTPVLVNLWGSWCEPCRDEARDLAAAHAEFGERVQFLGVDILDSRGSARDFMEEFGWRYPSVFDPPASIRDGLGLLGQPVTLLYGPDGDLVQRWVGPAPPDELDAALRAIVA